MREVTFTREKREKMVDAAVDVLVNALTRDRYTEPVPPEKSELALKVLRDIHQAEMDLMTWADAKAEADEEEATPDGP